MKKALVELWNGNGFPLSNHLKQTEEEKKADGTVGNLSFRYGWKVGQQ